MRGAVLYKLGMDFVKSRVMSKSYGVAFNAEFRPGYHPTSRKIECVDGISRCEDVMKWYVRKVGKPDFKINSRMPESKMEKSTNFLFSGILPLSSSERRNLNIS